MRKLVMSETEDAVLQKSLSSHDTVEYWLYPVKGEECSHESLTELAVGCTHLARSLTTDHIWHYEHFRLAAWAEEKGGPSLFGYIEYCTYMHPLVLWDSLTCVRARMARETIASILPPRLPPTPPFWDHLFP